MRGRGGRVKISCTQQAFDIRVHVHVYIDWTEMQLEDYNIITRVSDAIAASQVLAKWEENDFVSSYSAVQSKSCVFHT